MERHDFPPSLQMRPIPTRRNRHGP
jgi:hypothetical protein